MSTIKITDTEIFSNRLKTLRNGRRKADFAQYLNTSPQNYGRYENGRIPSTVILLQIANRCGVTVDWLLGRDNSSVQNPCHDRPVMTWEKGHANSKNPENIEDCNFRDRGVTKVEKGQCVVREDRESYGVEGELARMRDRLSGVEGELGHMRSQLDTVVGLLGAALGNGMDKGKTERKVG